MQFHQRRERQGKQPINIWASNIWTEKNHYPVTFIMVLCLKYDSLRLFPLPRQFLRGVSLPPASGSTPFGLKIRTSRSRGGIGRSWLPPAPGGVHWEPPRSQPPPERAAGAHVRAHVLKPGKADPCPTAENAGPNHLALASPSPACKPRSRPQLPSLRWPSVASRCHQHAPNLSSSGARKGPLIHHPQRMVLAPRS